MADRFFVTTLGHGDRLQLAGDEAHHLARVRRIAPGEHVQLFDGSGVECDAVVQEVSKREIVLAIVRRERVNRELPFSLTLGCVPPQGERIRWLIEKATELGTTRFIPLVTERASEQARGGDSEKMRRWVIEASKQCGRNVLMQIGEPMTWDAFLNAVPADAARFLAMLAAEPISRRTHRGGESSVAVAIGPEGGFTEREVQLAIERGWIAVGLGARILRVETAAIALLSHFTIQSS